MKRTPNGDKVSVELAPLFQRQFQLSGVTKGQTVMLFTDSMMNPAYPAAAFGGAIALGADVYQITVPSNGAYIESRSIVDAWKAADLVVGMCVTVPWLYSDAHNEALESGTRTLTIGEPEDILRRLFPTEEVVSRTRAGKLVMAKGERLRVTSHAGTDLTMSKLGRSVVAQYGYSDVPGRWDHWPSGLVGTAPVEGSVEGTLVIDAGDILINLGMHVSSPISCTVREGRIVDIAGGADARLLDDFFKDAHDPNAYVVSHIGWGTDHRALWSSIGLRFWEWGGIMDAESFYGNMQIAFGTNLFKLFGGQNRSRFHLDIPCRHHSFWVDDTLVMAEGEFKIPELV